MGYVSSSVIYAAAKRQVASAKAGRRLSDYRQAEDAPLFLAGADIDATAHYRVAWWYAVSAQMVGSDALLRRAEDSLSAGYWADIPVLNALWTGSVVGIFQTASAEISAAGLPSVGALLDRLGTSGVQTAALRTQQGSSYNPLSTGRAEEGIAQATKIAISGGVTFVVLVIVYKLINRGKKSS